MQILYVELWLKKPKVSSQRGHLMTQMLVLLSANPSGQMSTQIGLTVLLNR